MRIPQHVIDAVSARISLVDVVSEYLTLQKKGSRYWGLCPFHQEKTPSFSVAETENVYYCFGCQKGGGLFSFVQDMENYSFPEAIRSLAEKAGIEIPEDEADGSSQRDSMLELHRRVTGSFHYILSNSDVARDARTYLDERGVTKETIDQFEIGYAHPDPRWLYDFLRKKNYSREFLSESGLFSKKYPEYGFFVDRIIFPIRTRRGDVVAFGGRSFGGREPKYLNSSDSPIFSKKNNLFGISEGLQTIRKSRSFVIVEGYLDVVALIQAGITNAVAPLGTSFTEEQAAMLRRFAENGHILFDGDDAGVRAAEKAVAACEKSGIECEVSILPGGRDPADYMRDHDSMALEKTLQNRRKGFIFILDQALQRNDIRVAGGKESALRYLLPFVDIASTEVRKEAFLDEIADALQVAPEAVRSDYRRIGRGGRSVDRADGRKYERAETVSHDLYLMIAVAIHRSEFRYVRSRISVDDLQDEKARDVYVALEECLREEEMSFEAMLSHVQDETTKEMISIRTARAEFSEQGPKIIRDSVAQIKERSFKDRRERVVASLRMLEKKRADPQEIRGLLEETMWIDAELQKLKDAKE